MSQLDDVLDNRNSWVPRMSPPCDFDSTAQQKYQQRIDAITGTRNGRPLIKLEWAPDVLRWRPHPVSQEPLGYTFPIFFSHRRDGKEIAAPRWVLLERFEPQQYAPTAEFWERGRYINRDGSRWDVKGPCPPERYIELRAHAYHDGSCCPCVGDECHCGVQYNHCWGMYAAPNDRLLDWIRKVYYESINDSDVKPTEDIRTFEAPQAQRQVKSMTEMVWRKREEKAQEISSEISSFFRRQPVSTSGRVTASGLWLPN